MKRSVLRRKSRLRSRRPNPVSDRERIAREAWGKDLGGCVVCPAEGGECAGRVQGHHAIEKQALKRRGLHRYLWDLRNRVPVCEHRHEQHTSRYRPIPRELLPGSVFEFAAALGLTWWVEKNYPARTASKEAA